MNNYKTYKIMLLYYLTVSVGQLGAALLGTLVQHLSGGCS